MDAEGKTERQQAEEALRDREAKYRAVVETSSDGFCITDMTGRFLELNDAFAHHLGYSQEELLSMSVHDIEAQLTREEIITAIDKVRSEGRAIFVTKHRSKDGRVIPAEVTLAHWPLAGGRMFVFVRDITERQRAEETLLRSKERLDLLADSASQLLASISPQRVVDAICPRVMEFLNCDVFFNFLVDDKEGRLHLNACAGIPEEEVRRIEWLDYGVAVCGCAARDACRIISEDILMTDDSRTELVKSYGIQAYACHPLMVEGRVLGTLSFGTRTRSSFTEDELTLMKAVADQVAIAMDRKLAEEGLRRLNEVLEQRVKERTADLRAAMVQLESQGKRLDAVLENIPAYVALITKDRTIPFANREFIRRFGDPSGRLCHEYLFGLEEPCEGCKALPVFETKIPAVWEWAGADGITYQVHDYPFSDLDGSPLILEMGVDISNRKKMEQALKKSEEDLRLLTSQVISAQEGERKRIAMELHEGLGQSMTALKLYLRAIQRHLPAKARVVQEDFDGAHRLLYELVDDVRRISQDLQPLALENLGLTVALKSLMDEFSKYQEVPLKLDIDDIQHLFPPQTEIHIYRIFQEALNNIAKHAQATNISVKVAKRNGQVDFHIKDNGIGFDLKQIPHQRRLDKGMGLASIEERLRMIGSHLNIESRKGMGTEISFSIPIVNDLQ